MEQALRTLCDAASAVLDSTADPMDSRVVELAAAVAEGVTALRLHDEAEEPADDGQPERGDYAVLANRGASSCLGRGRAWLNGKGGIKLFTTLELAQAEAARLNSNRGTADVWYQGTDYHGGGA